MSRGRAPWQDGRRAWARLNGWHQADPNASPGHPDDGDAALKALVDVHLVRGLLDRAELTAVRTARRHGKSWTEIGTMLHVTKQAAWDRWHDTGDLPLENTVQALDRGLAAPTGRHRSVLPQ